MDDRTLPGDRNATLPTEEHESREPTTAATPSPYGRVGRERGPLTRVGSYRLDKLLGRGGMGEVHLGYDERLERRVAVKLLREGPRDQGRARTLMEREAKALAKLSHPNVVHVYEVGEHDGQTFIAMEYVEGRTLRAFVQQDPRPSWREIVAVFIEAGRGLLAAHEVGLVHRDFKPDNVIIGTDGHARVLDFGIARLVRDETARPGEAGAASNDTATSGVVGTLRYMPIEQYLRTGEGPASDQFAFCVALYEALWASDPFPAQTLGHRVLLVEEERFAAPPRGQAERALWPIVRRGLRAKIEDRWPDMRALLRALELVLARRRRRALWALGASLLGVGVVLGGLGPNHHDPCSGLEDELQQVWDASRGDRLEATLRELASETVAASARTTIDAWYQHWTDERLQLCHRRATLPEQTHADRLACLEVQRSEVDSLVESLEPRSPAPLSRAFASLPDSEVCRSAAWLRLEQPAPAIADEVQSLREQIAQAAGQRRAGRLQDSRALLEPTRARVHELGYVPLQIESDLGWARLLLDSGELEAGASLLETTTVEAEVIGHDWVIADGRALLVDVNVKLDRIERAKLWLELARAVHRRIGSSPEGVVPLTWLAARIELIEGRPDHARELLEPLIAALPVTTHPSAYYELLADIRTELGDAEGALQALEDGHARAVRDWGANYPDTLRSLPGLGLALMSAGRADEARTVLEAAVQGLSSIPDEPDLVVAQLALGKLELDRGSLELAKQWFLAAEQTLLDRDIGDPMQLANVDLALGVIARLEGQIDEAYARYTAGERRYAEHAPDDPSRARFELGRAMALLARDELDEAARAFDAVLAWSEPSLARVQTAARLGLAELQLRRNELDAAALRLAEVAAVAGDLRPDDRLTFALLDELLALRKGRRDRCLAGPRTIEADVTASSIELAQRILDQLELDANERRCLGWPPAPAPRP
jgi:tetratricopeptide (TPR) repeat protein/predicted Ser/Thr protein kinase